MPLKQQSRNIIQLRYCDSSRCALDASENFIIKICLPALSLEAGLLWTRGDNRIGTLAAFLRYFTELLLVTFGELCHLKMDPMIIE